MTRPRRRQAGEGRHFTEYKIKAGVRYWGEIPRLPLEDGTHERGIAARFPDP